MIISYRYNFIYFRPKKTAGSTISEVLRANLGMDDIDRKENLLGERKDRAHAEAKDVKEMVSRGFWKRSFKFASERHPYEKVVSLAYYRLGKRGRTPDAENWSFNEMVEQVLKDGGYCGFRHYSIDGQCIADDFVRQESLLTDLQRIGGKLGIIIPDELPRNKSRFRQDLRPAREILSPEQKNIIYERCCAEFELLGYER